MKLVIRLSSFVIAFAVAAATAKADPAVGQVLVHQLWPWSQNVRVEYTLSGTEGGTYDIEVRAYSNGAEIAPAKVRSALCGGEGFHSIAGDGIHTFTLDPAALLAEGATAIASFTVSVEVAGPGDPLGSRVEYRVFDLETGEVTDLRRRDIYDHPELYGSTVYTNYADVYSGFTKPAALPAEDVFIVPGFNADEFKTTKLVMKRIPAASLTADGSWCMGPVSGDTMKQAAGTVNTGTPIGVGESRFNVKLTSDFFIGVFELTQQQYALLNSGARPSFYSNETYWQTRPLENVDWTSFRGNADIPTSVSFVGALRTFTGKDIDLPTEAQWEFAAKAMYDGAGFPSGHSNDSTGFQAMEGMSNNNGVGNSAAVVAYGGGTGTVPVGTGRPNPFGLYNMFGNVCEFVCDTGANKDLATYYSGEGLMVEGVVTDPVCPNSATDISGSDVKFRIIKGGSFRSKGGQRMVRGAARSTVYRDATYSGSNSDRVLGFRLACPMD